MVGLAPTFAADTAAMCRSAVMALSFGRTPREGTAGHVASRRGLDQLKRPGGRRADSDETAGSRAMARRTSRPGPWRDAKRRRLGPNTPAMPRSDPAPAEGASRRKPGSRPLPNGTPQPPRRNGKRKVRRRATRSLSADSQSLASAGRTDRPSQLSSPRQPRAASRSGARPHSDVSPAAAIAPGAATARPPLFRSRNEIADAALPCRWRPDPSLRSPTRRSSAGPRLANRSFSDSRGNVWTVSASPTTSGWPTRTGASCRFGQAAEGCRTGTRRPAPGGFGCQRQLGRQPLSSSERRHSWSDFGSGSGSGDQCATDGSGFLLAFQARSRSRDCLPPALGRAGRRLGRPLPRRGRPGASARARCRAPRGTARRGRRPPAACGTRACGSLPRPPAPAHRPVTSR